MSICRFSSSPPSRRAVICPGRCFSLSFLLKVLINSRNNSWGSLARCTLRLARFVEIHEQVLYGRFVEFQHQPVERGIDARVGQHGSKYRIFSRKFPRRDIQARFAR